MLDKLQDMAAGFNMVFGYGQLEDLINLAQNFTGDPQPYLLWHEGYFLADWNLDGQGALEYRHRLVLDVCTPSKFADDPTARRSHLLGLEIEAQRVFKALTKLGEASGTRVELGLNLTPRNLDAIKITLTLLTPAVSLCRL
ncbi:hypothetical protein [Spirosoma agri]|uniref:Uncharacterized protein n=1 Tax=Spirosoma agri TaxID=1987381 RepID=A0A6M0IKN9_9BACT|nr:hypothetical protein [Spirosoma agri]NEU67941.1 hypothetical protein [Spirosoma agri]